MFFFPPSGTSACYRNITQQVSIVVRLSDKSKVYVMTALHCWIPSCRTTWDQMKAMQTPPGLIIIMCLFVRFVQARMTVFMASRGHTLFMGREYVQYKPQDASRCSARVNPQQRSTHLSAAGFPYWPQPSRECQMERRREGGGCFVWKLSAWDTMLSRPLLICWAKELVVISRSKQGQRIESAKWNGVFLQV